MQSAAATYYYGIRKIVTACVTVISLHRRVLLAKCTPYQRISHDRYIPPWCAQVDEAIENQCWFQTSLPLRRLIIACSFRVSALSGHAALVLSPSGIALELIRIQLSAVLLIYLLLLVYFLLQVALAQFYKKVQRYCDRSIYDEILQYILF